ncbi:hypothetical protein [Pukyongiella litopenaei]|uniref:Uncharacterized protein n=1 Tax=Pukyongiella litopenaei TaxID=2605946 RepID=A0A2S0ML68_9RHOB|nr:hypothetical protein [Pukyongiella litopenaei]AVO36612.1 hypothetical protein C6Y53_02130 [Pukyongiella litopenaei]
MTLPRRPSRRNPAVLKYRDHRRLWRLVEGGVVDAFRCHPDYLTRAGSHSAVQSITKRVVGQIVGHAIQARERGRPKVSRGGSGGRAEISGAADGAGRCTSPRTRLPDLHALLCGVMS